MDYEYFGGLDVTNVLYNLYIIENQLEQYLSHRNQKDYVFNKI